MTPDRLAARWPIVALVTVICLHAGDGPLEARDDSPFRSIAPSASARIVLREVLVKKPVKVLEEGLAVYVHVTTPRTTPPFLLDSMVTRYPSAGVLSSADGRRFSLAPEILTIPGRQDVTVAVTVVALPRTITVEGLNLIGFAVDKLAEQIADATLRRQPLGKFVGEYVVGRLADGVRAQLERGRVLGRVTSNGRTLAIREDIEGDEFSVVMKIVDENRKR